MAGRKEFELLFKLQATLGDKFKSSFTSAKAATTELQGTVNKLNSNTKNIKTFQNLSKDLDVNRSKLQAQKEKLEELKKAIESTDKPTDQMIYNLKKQEAAVEKTENKIQQQTDSLGRLRDSLESAGVSTSNLTAEQARLERATEQAALKQEKLAKIAAAQDQNKKAIAGTKRELAGVVGVATAVGAAIYAGPVKSAMEYESAMADVAKVVDGLKDGSGNFTKEYHQMKKEILDLTTVIPMTSKELTEIAAAAGQAGLAREEITKFAVDAGKMGIAFDTTAEQAGEWMAKWRTSFGLTQEQVVELADKINHLGDTSAAEAQQIANIVTKVGPLGEVAGFANGEIAALGATLISTGVAEDVAATGIKKLMTTMTAGTATTKRQQGVLQRLGISSTELAERMQKDATGAVVDFMGALNKLPEAQQAAALKDYFGQESIGALAPLLTNLGLLEEQFKKVGDASNYAGSMEEEYATRSATTENKVLLAKNSIGKLSRILGDTFLPAIGKGAERLSGLISGLADFAYRNPELISTIVKVAGALLAAKAGTLGLKLGFLQLKGGLLNVKTILTTLQGLKFAEGIKKMGGLLGGMKTKLLPIIAIVTALIVVIKLVSGNLEEIREKIRNTFGEGALAVFDKIVSIFKRVGQEAKNIFDSEALTGVRQFLSSFAEGSPTIETLRQILVSVIETITNMTATALPVLISLISSIIPIIGVLINAILPVVIDLITSILPVLQNIAEMVLPLLTGAIGAVAAVIQLLIEYGLPLLKVLLELLAPIITVLASVFTTVLQAALHNITGVLQGLTQTLGGIIDFITGVFTGNWQQAWQGLQDIFKGIFSGLVALAKSPLNLIIGAVNGVIKGLNKVKLPDWVPGIGGKGINIPTIPMLAKGSDSSPSTFIAGEEGPELITGAPGRKVFTALETGNIFGNLRQLASTVKAVAVEKLNTPRQQLAIAGAPGLNYAIRNDRIINIESKPVFNITNGDPEEIQEALKKSNENLKKEIKEELKEEREDERRRKYD